MLADRPAAGAALTLGGLTKRYGDVLAADGVSLDIEPGEFVTLLGPSGSGKTTTLNMIAGFVEPTAGEISMAGRPISRLPPHKRDIGMVFQNYALFPHMTAYDNVAFPLRQRKVPKDQVRRRVEDALALVQLAGHGDRYPRQLSGGQQQRVAFARAIVFSPQVLLMDEPLGALDKKLREWLQLEIKRIHDQLGTTFVHVTHDQEEALVLSDRIAVFNEGRVEQLGSAEELYERPRTLFVAEFIGDSNVLPGAVAASGDRVEIVGESYRVRAPAAPGLDVGGRGVVVVRPERLRVCEEAADDCNVLEVTVRQVVYLGSARKLELVLGDGRVVVAREAAGAHSAADAGSRVSVAWAVDDCVVLQDTVARTPEREELPAGAL